MGDIFYQSIAIDHFAFFLSPRFFTLYCLFLNPHTFPSPSLQLYTTDSGRIQLCYATKAVRIPFLLLLDKLPPLAIALRSRYYNSREERIGESCGFFWEGYLCKSKKMYSASHPYIYKEGLPFKAFTHHHQVTTV